MTWVDLSSAFSFGSKLTSTQMQNLRDNIQAAFNKDSGAPVLANGYIVEAMYGASSLDQTALKDATGNASGSLGANSGTDFGTQDFSFAHNYYGQDDNVRFRPASTSAASNYSHRFRLYNESTTISKNYDYYYRYITATDEPFIFILRNKDTGEIKQIWMAEDPPNGCWGLDEEPEDFEWPIIPDNIENFIHETAFKIDKDFTKEIKDRSKIDKKELYKVVDDYQYNKERRLFIRKNLSQI